MKLESAVVRLKGAGENIQNGISFWQDESSNAEKIMSRMTELKGLSQMFLRTVQIMITTTVSLNLQVQLFEMSKLTFNGYVCKLC